MFSKTSSGQGNVHEKVKFAAERSKNHKNDGGRGTLDSKNKGFLEIKSGRMNVEDVVDVRYNDDIRYKKENRGREMTKSGMKNKSFSEERFDGDRWSKPKPYVHEKVKFSAGRSKSPKNDGGTLDFRNKGFRENRSGRTNVAKALDVRYNNDNRYKKENGGREMTKLGTKNKSFSEQRLDGDRGSKLITYDRKRKRVSADQDNSRGGIYDENMETPTLKDFSKKRSEFKDDVGKRKHTVRGKSHDFEQLKKEKVFRGERRSHETRSDNNGGNKLRLNLNSVDRTESVREDGRGNSSTKKEAKNKSQPRNQSSQNQNECAAESIGRYAKKNDQGKKNVRDDLAEKGDRPKKKKRVIRIDPHDTSNKRLDDSMLTVGHTEEKKEDSERMLEMTKNAQFRAIKPSPSILSYVEDNLLGRRREIDLRRAGFNTELSAPLDNIAFSTSSERERIEESIFRNKLTFFAAANVSSSFPPPDLPEIAFAGRSNVGKSSLLNSLTRQWGVVRTSDKPGLTQTINFFKLGSKMCLVDLPGYGFAYAKEEVKEAWEELVKEYVSARVGLKRVCLLIDTKWGMKTRDHELIDLMERSQTKYQIVLTKTDLVFPIDVARRAMQIEESLKAKKSAVSPVMMVSSKSGAGIQCLRTVVAKIARFVKI